MGVRSGKDVCAGDQGFQIGYATNETDILLPFPIYMAQTILNYI